MNVTKTKMQQYLSYLDFIKTKKKLYINGVSNHDSVSDSGCFPYGRAKTREEVLNRPQSKFILFKINNL